MATAPAPAPADPNNQPPAAPPPVQNVINITTTVTKEVIHIDNIGRVFWWGREVETDDDFRAAMLDLASRLTAR